MAITLVTNNGSSNYTHSPAPQVTISEKATYDDANNDVYRREIEWKIEGELVNAGTPISTQMSALRTAYPSKIASAQIKDDSTVLESMPAEAGCGIAVESFEYPQGDGPELVTKRTYAITLKSVDYLSSVGIYGIYDYEIGYEIDQTGLYTRTISGRVEDTKDKSAYSKYIALVASMGWRTLSGYILTKDSYTQNKDNTVCTFSISHRQMAIAFPEGIYDAEYNYESTIDSQGVASVRISGFVAGSEGRCDTVISGYVPSNAIQVRFTKNRDVYGNKTSFSGEYVLLNQPNQVYFNEVVQVVPQTYDFVFKRLIGGLPPVRQNTSLTTCTVVQSGTIKNLTNKPAVPSPRFGNENVKRLTTQYSGPEVWVKGKYLYTLDYTYEYEFANNINPSLI